MCKIPTSSIQSFKSWYGRSRIGSLNLAGKNVGDGMIVHRENRCTCVCSKKREGNETGQVTSLLVEACQYNGSHLHIISSPRSSNSVPMLNMHVPWSVVKGPRVACLFLVWRSIQIFRYDEALNLNHRLHHHFPALSHKWIAWPSTFTPAISILFFSDSRLKQSAVLKMFRCLFCSASFIVGTQIWVKYSQFLLCFLKL